jgi:hypothetical protein
MIDSNVLNKLSAIKGGDELIRVFVTRNNFMGLKIRISTQDIKDRKVHINYMNNQFILDQETEEKFGTNHVYYLDDIKSIEYLA